MWLHERIVELDRFAGRLFRFRHDFGGHIRLVFDKSVIVRHPVVRQCVCGIEGDGLPEAFRCKLSRKVSPFQIELIRFGIRGLAFGHVRHLGVAETQTHYMETAVAGSLPANIVHATPAITICTATTSATHPGQPNVCHSHPGAVPPTLPPA